MFLDTSPEEGTLVIENNHDRSHEVTVTVERGDEKRRETFTVAANSRLKRLNYLTNFSDGTVVSAELETGESGSAELWGISVVVQVTVTKNGEIEVTTAHYD